MSTQCWMTLIIITFIRGIFLPLINTSDSVNVSLTLNASSGNALLMSAFQQNDSGVVISPRHAFAVAVASTWHRVTVGFAGSTAYARVYNFDADGIASDQNLSEASGDLGAFRNHWYWEASTRRNN